MKVCCCDSDGAMILNNDCKMLRYIHRDTEYDKNRKTSEGQFWTSIFCTYACNILLNT